MWILPRNKNKQLKWNDTVSHKKISNLLQAGKVVVGPSDTVPGLLVAATVHGYQQLDRIKGRKDKPYLLLVADKEKLSQFVSTHTIEQLAPLMDAFWPGPLTMIMHAKDGVVPPMCTQQRTIAVRIPHHPGLQAVLAQVPALFSTSANKAGKPVPSTVDAIDAEILRSVDAVVRDKAKEPSPASTIIDCTQRPCTIVREGALAKEDLQKYLA